MLRRLQTCPSNILLWSKLNFIFHRIIIVIVELDVETKYCQYIMILLKILDQKLGYLQDNLKEGVDENRDFRDQKCGKTW